MRNAHSLNPEFQRNKKRGNRRLKKRIEKVIADNPKMAFEYQAETLKLNLAGIIHRLRIEAGISQEKLAEIAGVAQPFIARLEHPTSSKHPTLDTLAKIARAFKKRLILQFTDL